MEGGGLKLRTVVDVQTQLLVDSDSQNKCMATVQELCTHVRPASLHVSILFAEYKMVTDKILREMGGLLFAIHTITNTVNQSRKLIEI